MFTVPYGKGTIQFSLPSGMRVTQAVSKPVRPIEDRKIAVADALAHPVGTPPLRRWRVRTRHRLHRYHRSCDDCSSAILRNWNRRSATKMSLFYDIACPASTRGKLRNPDEHRFPVSGN
jgi:hypothetical protein